MQTTLSKTEAEILEMRIQGMSRKEIAAQTFRSELTIKTHFQNIQKKTQLHEETQIVIWYVEEVLGVQVKKLLNVSLALMLVIAAELEQSDMLRAKRVKASARTARVRAARKGKRNENFIWS